MEAPNIETSLNNIVGTDAAFMTLAHFHGDSKAAMFGKTATVKVISENIVWLNDAMLHCTSVRKNTKHFAGYATAINGTTKTLARVCVSITADKYGVLRCGANLEISGTGDGNYTTYEAPDEYVEHAKKIMTMCVGGLSGFAVW